MLLFQMIFQFMGPIQTDQIKCLDWHARNAVFAIQMPDEIVAQVSDIVEAIIWGE